MSTRQLPPRPSLDQLKHQAKDLLRQARRGDAAALSRFRVLPAYTDASDARLARSRLALHDAQSVVAREHGFASWNALHAYVEAETLAFDAAVIEFVEAATDGRSERAARILSLHPGIIHASFHAALVMGDDRTVTRHLDAQPDLAVLPGGPRGWAPLLYLCHTAMVHSAPERGDGVVAIARRLLGLGADPNARFPWLHHGVRRPVLWGAAFETRQLALVSLLLDAGADPDDGVTLPLAVSAGNTDLLDLLARHGADVNQPWATDGSAALYAALTWARTPTGAFWLLEHGADPDPVFSQNGETPLHVVARSWDVDLADALVRRGADVARRSADGRTPYAVAVLAGNHAVAEWLLAHGATDELSTVDRLVAACAGGDQAQAGSLLARDPSLRDAITGAHYAVLYLAAERNDLTVLGALLSCGFDPNRPDESIGKTALHVAAMEGWPDAVRLLLSHGASVSVRDREFQGQPLVWAAEGSRTSREGRDHAAVAKLLLDAGSPVDWQAGAEPAEQILDIIEGWTSQA